MIVDIILNGTFLSSLLGKLSLCTGGQVGRMKLSRGSRKRFIFLVFSSSSCTLPFTIVHAQISSATLSLSGIIEPKM
jgi:hypothetical protein